MSKKVVLDEKQIEIKKLQSCLSLIKKIEKLDINRLHSNDTKTRIEYCDELIKLMREFND